MNDTRENAKPHQTLSGKDLKADRLFIFESSRGTLWPLRLSEGDRG
jgi:hypothetical protein